MYSNLSVGWDLISYPLLHQFLENDTVLCFSDVVWKVVDNFCTTVSVLSLLFIIPAFKFDSSRIHDRFWSR